MYKKSVVAKGNENRSQRLSKTRRLKDRYKTSSTLIHRHELGLPHFLAASSPFDGSRHSLGPRFEWPVQASLPSTARPSERSPACRAFRSISIMALRPCVRSSEGGKILAKPHIVVTSVIKVFEQVDDRTAIQFPQKHADSQIRYAR